MARRRQSEQIEDVATHELASFPVNRLRDADALTQWADARLAHLDTGATLPPIDILTRHAMQAHRIWKDEYR